MKIGLLGGYGLQEVLSRPKEEEFQSQFEDEQVLFPPETKKGEPERRPVTCHLYRGRLEGKSVIVVPRHGKDHSLPPHSIPFKSYIAKFEQLDVVKIISINSVGIMNTNYSRGSFILMQDFVNEAPEPTFYDVFPQGPVHINMSRPYDRELNHLIEKTAAGMNVPFHSGAVYVNVPGPRLETPSEIKRKYIHLGDVVGMTGALETILANEKGIPISSIGLGANYAEGLGESVEFEQVLKDIKEMQPGLHKLLREVIKRIEL